MSEGVNNESAGKENPRESLNVLQVIGSVFSAGLGVQSSANRERDFERGNLRVFIIAGLVFTLGFVATIYTVVQLVR